MSEICLFSDRKVSQHSHVARWMLQPWYIYIGMYYCSALPCNIRVTLFPTYDSCCLIRSVLGTLKQALGPKAVLERAQWVSSHILRHLVMERSCPRSVKWTHWWVRGVQHKLKAHSLIFVECHIYITDSSETEKCPPSSMLYQR